MNIIVHRLPANQIDSHPSSFFRLIVTSLTKSDKLTSSLFIRSWLHQWKMFPRAVVCMGLVDEIALPPQLQNPRIFCFLPKSEFTKKQARTTARKFCSRNKAKKQPFRRRKNPAACSILTRTESSNRSSRRLEQYHEKHNPLHRECALSYKTLIPKKGWKSCTPS